LYKALRHSAILDSPASGPGRAIGSNRRSWSPVSPEPISVLVVDDVALVRERIVELIEADERLELVGEASEGRRALELIAARRPAVVVLDIFMPEMAGDEVLYRLRRDTKIDVKVLVLTAGPTPELHDALLQRPDSMLYKSAVGSATICEEIVALANGESSPGRELLRKALTLALTRPELTEAELEVLRHAAEGQRAQAIAFALERSVPTVRKQLQDARRKLGVTTTVGAVARAYEIGLLPRQRGPDARHLPDNW
jgi:DNA-binding NarL/FixJ family response regulator